MKAELADAIKELDTKINKVGLQFMDTCAKEGLTPLEAFTCLLMLKKSLELAIKDCPQEAMVPLSGTLSTTLPQA